MFSRLSHKIYAYFVLLNLVINVFVLVVVNSMIERHTDSTFQRRFDETVLLLEQQLKSQADALTAQGLVLSRAPRLLAAVSTEDHETILDIAQIFREQVKSNLFTVIGKSGKVMARVHEHLFWGDDLSYDAQISRALAGEIGSGLLSYNGEIYQAV